MRGNGIKLYLGARGEAGPILMYSPFERRVLRRLQQACPELAEGLQGLTDRLVDLLPQIRAGYYHPEQKGSWSIKRGLPTVAPELSYGELGVQDGLAAMDAYLDAIDKATADERRQRIESELRSYCSLDTLAMVRLVEVFCCAHPTADQTATEATADAEPAIPGPVDRGS